MRASHVNKMSSCGTWEAPKLELDVLWVRACEQQLRMKGDADDRRDRGRGGRGLAGAARAQLSSLS